VFQIKKRKLLRVSPALPKAIIFLLRFVNRRIFDLMIFGVEVAQNQTILPKGELTTIF